MFKWIFNWNIYTIFYQTIIIIVILYLYNIGRHWYSLVEFCLLYRPSNGRIMKNHINMNTNYNICIIREYICISYIYYIWPRGKMRQTCYYVLKLIVYRRSKIRFWNETKHRFYCFWRKTIVNSWSW